MKDIDDEAVEAVALYDQLMSEFPVVFGHGDCHMLNLIYNTKEGIMQPSIFI